MSGRQTDELRASVLIITRHAFEFFQVYGKNPCRRVLPPRINKTLPLGE